MTTKTRFAPSPTGHLHIGNIRTALHNWMWARKTGGHFVLRIDDTDKERSKEEYVTGIQRDMQWLGLDWDSSFRQSERFDAYEAAFEKLKADGRVYPCYETAQELDLKRKVLRSRGLAPVYDRGALELTAEQIAAYEAEGRTPHWRFKLDHDAPIVWDDLVRGPQKFDPPALSDPVIRRADGSWLYMLPSTIDDADHGVTHVVRGEDHVANTAAQIQMFEALGADIPTFAHSALLMGKEGKLSKRLGSMGVSDFREQHIEPQAVLALLARLGTSDPVIAESDITHLVDTMDFSRFGRAPAKFDPEDLARLNTQIVHGLDYGAVAERLPKAMDDAAWHAIRPNVAHLGEVADWWAIVEGPVELPEFDEETRAYLKTAHDTLTGLDWSDAVWGALTGALKEATGRKGKALFMPLRQALTGQNHGPDMAEMVPILGRDVALRRLERAAQ
ncbi:glutamate--tRNA ligase [Alterisphingorhabdus coralli]|uniref:Glutamate--tRNA ligase n=1 Tax=Alterisphingorhabdus coralli TaxID=3071408 RepID=A0AA97I045_9SPHN|nr:glutamate--tRNA ligase [Parasphingorhabdus sp. SCSIO 66989]WOE75409.1 glutamate--tRNA ligase [Parasphingorhabdus sp. SCSIO 66989]